MNDEHEVEVQTDAKPHQADAGVEGDDAFAVKDRRHWQQDDETEGRRDEDSTPRPPSIIDEYRQRTEEAETKLHEYIEAFKAFRVEQDAARARLMRDVDRKVEQRFGGLVADLLVSIDHLDLALRHSESVAEAAPLREGVSMARDGFINTLLQAGIDRIQPEGQEFDPNEAEALRIDPVAEKAQHNRVTETLRPGYRLGETVIRPARVAVGRHQSR